MAKLPEAQKRFIAQSLACWDTPSQVADAVKEEFSLDVHRSQVAQYDPTKAAGQGLAKKWVELYWSTREGLKNGLVDTAVAQRNYRLRQLGKIYERHMQRGNLMGAAVVLEQAAKESGGAFTNRREHTGAGGGPIEQKTVVVDETQVAAAVAKLQGDY
ncbi:DUF2280 domain-containing protein [Achromobacter marplatensis]|uniref:DUF2280 domain-containing protein n=1 Tax=Achromobacter marplatensis TaxID=470868 RepID=UPI0028E9E7D0|nr:DUF2280 domain-containing protein [Achromobacter marplatensis]